MNDTYTRFFHETGFTPGMERTLHLTQSVDKSLNVHVSQEVAKLLVDMQKAWMRTEERLRGIALPKEISFSCNEYGIEIYDIGEGKWLTDTDAEIVLCPAFITIRVNNRDRDLDPADLTNIAYQEAPTNA